MKKNRTREDILEDIEKLEEELEECEESNEDKDFRKACRKFAKQLDIMVEETRLTREQCLDFLEKVGEKNDWY